MDNSLFLLQQVDRIQQAEKTKLATAEAKITALETENESLKTEVASLKSTLDCTCSFKCIGKF